jgi:hypothetical protein
MYRELHGEAEELRERLAAPGAPIVDRALWLQANDLSADLLKILPTSAEDIPDASLSAYVNAVYDLLLITIYLTKTALDVPRVPRAKR